MKGKTVEPDNGMGSAYERALTSMVGNMSAASGRYGSPRPLRTDRCWNCDQVYETRSVSRVLCALCSSEQTTAKRDAIEAKGQVLLWT